MQQRLAHRSVRPAEPVGDRPRPGAAWRRDGTAPHPRSVRRWHSASPTATRRATARRRACTAAPARWTSAALQRRRDRREPAVPASRRDPAEVGHRPALSQLLRGDVRHPRRRGAVHGRRPHLDAERPGRRAGAHGARARHLQRHRQAGAVAEHQRHRRSAASTTTSISATTASARRSTRCRSS